MICRTAGARPLEISVGFGHVPGAPIVALRMLDNSRTVPVIAPQWWLDDRELRLHLTDPQALRSIAVLTARRVGNVYDGSVLNAGKRRWMRCRED